MSAMTFGNPWHGTMTPAGLVLADTTLKTSMDGTDTDGSPKVFSYAYVGDAAVGHTYYHKVPGLPTPDTPTNLSSIGGEFKNDVILSGLTRRYSPFVYNGGVAQNEWLHYGDDGRWRKLAITTTTYGPKTQTVEIRRKGLWGDIGGTLPTENVLIATLVLTHTSPVSWVFPLFTPLDVSFDGRAITVGRTDITSGSFSSIVSEGFWDETKQKYIAAWRIDINAACTSASDTLVWQLELPIKTPFVNPPALFTATGPVFYTGGPSTFSYWEPYEGHFWGNDFRERFQTERLLGTAFAPDGSLHVLIWDYDHNYENKYWYNAGTTSRGSSGVPMTLPPSMFPTSTKPTPNFSYPFTQSWTQVNDTQIDVRSNATVLHSMDDTATKPMWSEAMTNNVFNLKHSSQSVGRFGPGAADVGNVTPPVFGSFNPRDGAVHTSATPIGFI
ncbi:MAG: hypothetical protein KBH41_15195 [Azonexus sp.]|nr:hypothetical protein [Azonexus sp.]